MIKKEITFDGFDGDEVTETHYFNLGPKDIVDLEAEVGGGLESWVSAEVASKDEKRAMAMLIKFIARGYGVRVGDTGFEKTEEASDKFLNSLAFQGLFDELLTDQEKLNAFVLGMFPKKLMAKADAIIAAREASGESVSPDVERARRILAEAAPDVPPAKVVQSTVLLPESDSILITSGIEAVQPNELTRFEVSDAEFERMQEDLRSGLKYPRDDAGNLLPWAFREPTRKEQGHAMTQKQFVDAMRRKNDPEWEPTVGG